MEIYNYDSHSGAFVNAEQAHPSPFEEGVFLIPAHATTIAPPGVGPTEVAVFDTATQTWSAKPDYRKIPLYETTTGKKIEHAGDILSIPAGATAEPFPKLEAHQAAVFEGGKWVVKPDWRDVHLFETANGMPAVITEIGIAPEDRGLTDVAPLPTPCKWDAKKQKWVDDLDGVKAKKSAELSAACQKAITGGAVSSALGAPYTYPTQPADQQNLASSVLLSTLPNAGRDWSTLEMCADSATPPVWAYRKHTAAQIQQVASDVKAAILALRVKNDTLQGKVAAAKTVAAVNAIAW